MLRTPPDILITTPESLYLLLTSRGTEMLAGIRSVIVDEIHAVAGTKRGAHLALSLERLERLVADDGGTLQRIGLSATQRPLSEIARFLGGQDARGPPAPGRRSWTPDREGARPRGDRPGGGHARAGREPLEPRTRTRRRSPGAEGRRRSIWPAMYPELLELVRAHRSTLIFVNNRRLAERLALRLNELAEEEVARAHHGSLAREQRTLIEEELKAGRLPAPRGHEQPRARHRHGRGRPGDPGREPAQRGARHAAHRPRRPPGGRAQPRAGVPQVPRRPARVRRRGRADARAARSRRPACPRLPLDVLAQQIVAMCSDGELDRRRPGGAGAGRLPLRRALARAARGGARHARRAATPRTSSPSCGRGSSGTAPPARCAAATGPARSRCRTPARSPTAASTPWCCPTARGWASSTRRWSTRRARGQTFMLGASTWRIEEITRDRVIVTPAPGAPGAVPFWKGEGVGRPYELGEAVGRLARELVAAAAPSARPRGCAPRAPSTARAATNLVAYLEDQAAATGTVPSDRAIVVERFRDEIGDWRLCVLTPFGARVHAPVGDGPGARASARRPARRPTRSGATTASPLHLPDADEAPPSDIALIAPDELEELVLGELGGTALFGARFRENAARALLIPRRRPGQRTPLWQQRLKASSLLQVARRFGSFPVILETYRECLERLVRPARPARRAGPDRLARAGGGRGRDRDGVAVRRLPAVRVRRVLHVRGRHAGRRAPRPGAVAQPRPAARAARPGGAARPDRRRARSRRSRPTCRASPSAPGRAAPTACTTCCAASATSRRPRSARGWPSPPTAAAVVRRARGRAAGVRDPARRRGAGHRRRGRRAATATGSGVMPPERPARRVPGARARRPARAGGALGPRPRAVPHGRARRALRPRAAARSRPIAGRPRDRGRARARRAAGPAAPGASGATPRSCAACAARAWRRCGGRSSRPTRGPSGASCPTGSGSTGRAPRAGADALREVLGRCRGWRCRPPSGRARCSRGGSPTTAPARLDELAARGEIVWVGAGRGRRRRRAGGDLLPRGRAAAAARPRRDPRAGGPGGRRAARRARRRAPASGTTCSRRSRPRARRSSPRSGRWSGPARSPTTSGCRCARPAACRRCTRPAPAGGRRRRAARAAAPRRPSRGAGRWPSGSSRAAPPPDERRRALAELLVERHGVLTRSAALSEGVPGGFAAVYPALARPRDPRARAAAATSWRASAARSSRMPGAVERLRDLRDAPPGRRPRTSWCWAPPTRPSRTARPSRGRAARAPRSPSRVFGAQVVLVDGRPALYLERGGRSLLTFAGRTDERALAAASGPGGLGPGRPPPARGDRARRRRAGLRLAAGGRARRGRLPRRPAGDGAARIGPTTVDACSMQVLPLMSSSTPTVAARARVPRRRVGVAPTTPRTGGGSSR